MWSHLKFYFRLFCGLSRPVDFVEFLSCSDREIRWGAADLLSSIGDKSVAESVFEILQTEPDMMVAKKLVWTLARGEAWDKIFLLLDSPRKSIREWAADSLRLSEQGRFVVPLLERIKECEGNDPNYKFALRDLVDKNSVKPILNLLSQASSPRLKGDLLYLLGCTRDPQVFDILEAELDNQDEVIRSGVVSGLVALGVGDARVVDALQKLLTDSSQDIRVRAQGALKNLEKS